MNFWTKAYLTLLSGVFAAVVNTGCGYQDQLYPQDDLETGKAEGILSYFNPNWLMYDSLFSAVDAVEPKDVQAFFESTPYGSRCFLADEKIGKRTAAEVLHEAALSYDVNPILLLARLQVEKSLVNMSERPSESTLEYALGCGAYDDTSWLKGVQGLELQLACAAKSLSRGFYASQTLVGSWQSGLTKKTEDGHSVTPANNATAALYAYTPWVYGENNKGGNWLAWSVTEKFVGYFVEHGRWHYEVPGWIGTPCSTEDPAGCDFRYRQDEAWCLAATGDQGVCSMDCRGVCPDHAGVQTFCVEFDGKGACVAKSDKSNNFCQDLPNTYPTPEFRFLGVDSAIPKLETVCMPHQN